MNLNSRMGSRGAEGRTLFAHYEFAQTSGRSNEVPDSFLSGWLCLLTEDVLTTTGRYRKKLGIL
jgi:hypothetical protein